MLMKDFGAGSFDHIMWERQRQVEQWLAVTQLVSFGLLQSVGSWFCQRKGPEQSCGTLRYITYGTILRYAIFKRITIRY